MYTDIFVQLTRFTVKHNSALSNNNRQVLESVIKENNYAPNNRFLFSSNIYILFYLFLHYCFDFLYIKRPDTDK